jgi:putative ABC transport system permease protein
MGPIIRALLKSKTAAILIVLEIAITLAIVSNALSLIDTRRQAMARGTGVEESRVFSVYSLPIDPKTYPADAAMAADRAQLLQLPGVENAYASDSLPLTGSGSSTSVSLMGSSLSDVNTATYYGDENTLATLGIKLVAGRNFVNSDISTVPDRAAAMPRTILVSKALAAQLVPNGSVVGKRLEGPNGEAGPEMIGVYERLQAPWNQNENIENTAILPFRPAGYQAWVIRAAPEHLASLMTLAPAMLASADRTRVISSQVESMAQIRAGSYADARAMIVLMSLLSVLLVVITALGIVGMASFWVTQRTKQIGTRRALGARRTDIVREFQLENLILTAAGSLVGIALAYVVNYAFAHVAGIAKLPLVFVLIGVLVVFALGQIAIWRPAQRASRIAPAIATRSV